MKSLNRVVKSTPKEEITWKDARKSIWNKKKNFKLYKSEVKLNKENIYN